MSDEDEKCSVCGDTLDFYGCLGEMRGRHVPIEMDKLRADVAENKQALAGAIKQLVATKQDLQIALEVAEQNGRKLEAAWDKLNKVRSVADAHGSFAIAGLLYDILDGGDK